MQPDAAFHQGLHCLLSLKPSSGKNIHHDLENSTWDPLIGNPILIVWENHSECKGLKIVSMIRKYHNHKPQTTVWHHEEEPLNHHETHVLLYCRSRSRSRQTNRRSPSRSPRRDRDARTSASPERSGASRKRSRSERSVSPRRERRSSDRGGGDRRDYDD